MGGGSSGSTMQTSNSNSTNTSGPNPYIVPQLQNLVGGATDWMNNNQTAPGYFPGGTVADPGKFSTSARDQTWGYAQNGIHTLGSQFAPSVGYLNDAANGKYLDVANDPNWQNALAASLRPQTEQFRDVLAPGIDSTFAGAGRTAGGAHFDTMMRGVNDLTRNQADASAKAASDRYNQERGYQSGAAQALPGVLGAQQGQAGNWLSMLQGVGAGDDQYRQRMLSDQNAKYGYDTTSQLDWYQRLSQNLQGMYPGGQTTGQQSGMSTGTGSPAGGGAGSFLGPAMGMAGLGLQAAAMFSDENLKDVAGRVGFTDEGLPLYLYKYKGTSEPRIGPIAQEVEDLIPGAVTEHPSGYKIVDYSRLVPEGGLL